jgi:hypothetical protein
MSNAVRTGVVTNMSPIWMISSVSIRSLRTTIPGGGRPLRQIISMGVAAFYPQRTMHRRGGPGR